MPGNELGDGVHNFFAQDNSLQGQHHSQVVEGNWPVLNSNFWVGSQRQVNLLNSTDKNFSSQHSDLDRGEGSYPLQLTHGLNFSQPNSRPEYTRSQSVNEQPNSSGFTYGNQFQQASQNEANLLEMDTDPDQPHLMTSRGLSFQELQQGSGTDNHQAKATVRSVTSVSPVSFDLFGGQQHIGHHRSSMPQSLQRQQSGINDMQQLQQQLMIRNLQELQRKEQLRQLDLRQHHLVSQVPPFTKQTSASQPALVNGTPNSDSSPHPWTSEIGTNWLNRGSPTMQVSPNGLVFPPNIGNTQRLVDLVPQQVDQSLYGVPISSSRGLPVNQYSQVMTDRSPTPQMSISNNNSQRSNQNNFPNQIGLLDDESSISTQKFENENLFGLATRHSLNTEMRNVGTSQPVNSMSRNAPQQDFMGRQEATTPPEASREKPSRQAASPQNEVGLDPTEAKILFGSDDNIWAAFGDVPRISGDDGNSFDNSGLLNGTPSLQSGSWSALMQSAVAETSSCDVAPQEEWSGLTFHYNDNRPLTNQSLSMHNDTGKHSMANDSMRTPSAPSSASFPPSDSMSTNKAMGLNQIGHNFQDGPGQRLPTEMSQRFVQSMEEANKWSKSRPMNRSVAEGSQTYGNASQPRPEIERNAKSIYPTLAPGQAGTRIQQNGWNALAAIPPARDIMQNSYEAERFSLNSQNNRVMMMQGELVHASSLLKSNSIPSTAIESGDVKYAGNPQVNKGVFSSNNAASLARSGKAGPSDETSSFVQNNYALNQWKNAHPAVASHGGESLGRRLRQANERNQVLDSMNSRYDDENSNDSHLSNMSQHTFSGFREGGLSDASDSQSLQSGKQKSNNQLSRKVSAPRKFQYHPMGNVHEDVEPGNGLKQPIRLQAMSEQNSQFVQAKLFGHAPRNSTAMEKGHSFDLQRDSNGPDEESSRGNFSSNEANLSNKASSTSQNMLELLHKVDQTNDHDAMMQHSSSEHNASSQRLEEEKNDGFGRLQRNQSSVPHGFGLQLGPPSQRLQIADHTLSSQNGLGTVGTLYSGRAAPGMEDKCQQMVSSPSQSLPSVEETQAEFNRNKSAVQGNGGNEDSLYKMSGNFTLAPSSGAPHFRTHIQDQQMTGVSGEISVNQHINHFSGNVAYSTQGGSMGTFLPGASGSVQQNNLASSGVTSQQSGRSDIQERVPTSTIPTRDRDRTSQHFSMSGIARQGDSEQGLHYVWTNVPRHQHKSSTPFQQNMSHIPEFTQPNIIESSSALGPQGYVNSQGVIDGEEQRLKASSDQPAASLNADPVPKMKESLGKTSSMKNRLDDSPANSASTQKDIEAFERSLKPSSFPHQNYSLLNPMQALKDAEIDSSHRVSKRIKGSDDSVDVHEPALKVGQLNDQSAVFGESMVSGTAVPSEDSRMLSFSRPADILQRNTSEHGIAASKDTLGLGQDVSQSNSCSDYTTTVKLDHPQVSPQMAPSWFNQYGTFRNGQILQVYGERRVNSLRPGEPPFSLGKFPIGLDMQNSEQKGTFSSVDAGQSGRHQNSSNSLVAEGHFSSPHSSQMNVTSHSLVNLGPKKRKSCTSELHPWYKEISGGSPNLWTISMAESEWNKAVNRLNEKVEDGAEIIEDGPPALRSKRRLILTTQLMQQLIRPAPSAILSADASLNYENVAYIVSKIALGDACGAASLSSDSDVTHDSMDLLITERKSSERNSGRFYAKAVEELIGRARKLENDFLRLDKSASVLDLRIECQDLEKFSVINRFARFHGRGQSDNAETSSDVITTAQKPIPQRYVSAVPVPRSFPDRVQCLSL